MSCLFLKKCHKIKIHILQPNRGIKYRKQRTYLEIKMEILASEGIVVYGVHCFLLIFWYVV